VPRLIAAGYPHRWTSVVGALEGVLQALGHAVATSEIGVLSGHAFRFALTSTPDGEMGADGPNHFAAASALPLYEGLGRQFEATEAAAAEREFAKRREETLKRVRKSIDRGRPAILFALHLPEFGIVRGYDRDDLIAATTMSPQYGERIPTAQWPAPGRPLPIRALLPDKDKRVDRDLAVERALRFAISYAHVGERQGPPGGSAAHTGLAAYDRWIALLEGTEPISPHGQAYCIQALQEARNSAAALMRVEAVRRPALSAPFDQAAAAYSREVLALSQVATLFPYPNGGDVRSLGVRRAGASCVRRALAAEQEALAAIERCIG
jgi:hypothetical protein